MRLAYIALVSVALLSAACSTAVDGSAPKDTNASKAPTVDISKLDVGPYPTKPSQRMSDNVIGPWEVDAALTRSTGGATVLLNPSG